MRKLVPFLINQIRQFMYKNKYNILRIKKLRNIVIHNVWLPLCSNF